jgi:hypothetical protein
MVWMEAVVAYSKAEPTVSVVTLINWEATQEKRDPYMETWKPEVVEN